MPKNLWGKTRDRDDPYEIWVVHDPRIGEVEYRILKSYQGDNQRQFARFYVFGHSAAMPTGEYGDVYCSSVLCGRKCDDREKAFRIGAFKKVMQKMGRK